MVASPTSAAMNSATVASLITTSGTGLKSYSSIEVEYSFQPFAILYVELEPIGTYILRSAALPSNILLKDCIAYVDHDGHLKALKEMAEEGIGIE